VRSTRNRLHRQPDGISGPNAQITLGSGGTNAGAKDLALVLQTGALAGEVRADRADRRLGDARKDSLRQAWHAAAVGLAIGPVPAAPYRFLASSPSSARDLRGLLLRPILLFHGR